MKKTLGTILLLTMFSVMLALTAGDIAIIGAIADNPDVVPFIALVDIPGGTLISLTDNGWDATNQTWRAQEGTLVWTCPTGGVESGTVVVLTDSSPFTASIGTVSMSGSFSLSTDGDQILAYQGTTAPSSNSSSDWLFGFSLENWSYANSSTTSDYPTALVAYNVAMSTSASEYDNAYFANGSSSITSLTLSGTKEELLVLFSTPSLYYRNNTRPSLPQYSITVDEPLPVVLSSFTASISAQNYVTLTWVTQTETGMLGYYVYRATDGQLATAELVSPMVGASNSSTAQTYVYSDNEIYNSGTYFYWLESVDFDGNNHFFGPVSIVYDVTGEYYNPEIPLVTELRSVYPNPFNPIAYIPFSLGASRDVSFNIYNNRGQIVREFNIGEKLPGEYRLEWDGRDDNGQALSSGVYYIRMTAGRDSFQRKAVLMK